MHYLFSVRNELCSILPEDPEHWCLCNQVHERGIIAQYVMSKGIGVVDVFVM